MLRYVSAGYARLVLLGKFKCVWDMLVQVRLVYVRSGSLRHVRSGYFMLGHFGSGKDRLGNVRSC
jgi:hypothetical protein